MGQSSQPTSEMANNSLSDTPEAILGIQKRHLPERFERYFLDDDIILFKHRALPEYVRKGEYIEWDNSDVTNAFPLKCHSCLVDQICAWVVLIIVALVSIRLGFGLFSSPTAITTLALAPGFLMAIFIQTAASLFIWFSRSQVHGKTSDEDVDNHVHPVRYLVENLLGEGRLHSFDVMLWKFGRFEEVWAQLHFPNFTNGFKYEHDEYRPVSPLVSWALIFQDHGLVLRLARYPIPSPLTYICCTPWLGGWIDEVYQTYKYYQRSQAASRAYDALERTGSLASDASPPPDEYSIQRLEREVSGFIFLPTWTFDFEANGM